MIGLGIFGGTFDPIHNAHLAVACAALQLCNLKQILFVPAANPPHRATGPRVSFEDRFRMVELACAAEPRFQPSRIEEGNHVSYSIVTIEKLQAQHPGTPLYFIIGADAFAEIQTWKRWTEVIARVEFIVAGRPGAHYSIPDGARLHRLPMDMPISSSAIRDSLVAGIAHLPLPPAVEAYISAHQLYRSHSPLENSISL
jgi:nicotinate-nucleotide adenylyltransferase